MLVLTWYRIESEVLSGTAGAEPFKSKYWRSCLRSCRGGSSLGTSYCSFRASHELRLWRALDQRLLISTRLACGLYVELGPMFGMDRRQCRDMLGRNTVCRLMLTPYLKTAVRCKFQRNVVNGVHTTKSDATRTHVAHRRGPRRQDRILMLRMQLIVELTDRFN